MAMKQVLILAGGCWCLMHHDGREVANRRQHGPQSTAFILHFTSPDEAQRAVREKQHCEIAEKRISIVAYR